MPMLCLRESGLPNALLEAMMVGLPVVGNDDGGTGEQIINKVTGLLIPEPAPALLASALKQVLFDRDLRKNWAEKPKSIYLDNLVWTRWPEAISLY